MIEELDKITVSYGRTVKSNKLIQTTFKKVVDTIRRDQRLKDQINKLRQLSDKQDFKKKNLPYFNMGIFENGRRSKTNLISSQHLLFDYDKLTDEALSEMKDKLKADRNVFCFFISPSGNGIKVIYKLDKPITDHQVFTKIYKSYADKFNVDLGVNPDKTSDAGRACFFSYDPDIYINKSAVPLKVEVEAETNIEAVDQPSSELKRDDISKFDNILKECSHVRNIVENGENINNADRLVLGNLLANFGEGGRAKLHEILSKVPNYDRDTTDYHLDKIREQDYKPVSCETVCGKVCQSVQALNRKSCLSLRNVIKANKYIETYFIEKFIRYRTDIIYSLKEDLFYQYRDGVYNHLPEVNLATILTSLAKVFNNEANVVATRMKAAVERLKIEEMMQFKGLMNEGSIINMKNGLFNLNSGELMPHTPSVYTSIQLDFDYDRDARAPMFERFLNEIFDDPDKIDYVLNTMCYLLLPNYSYQKVFIFFGSGRNGKSVLTSVISNLIGVQNVSNLSIHDLAQNRFALVNLKDKLLNISSEIGSRDLETEMIKKLSGGDGITADRKYKNPLSFINIARLIVNANELPRFSELNEAILERFVLIRFPRTFRDANTNLLNELLEELPGIFNLVIERVESIRRGGGVNYPIPESIQKDRIILLGEISSAAEFINENCELIPNGKIKLYDLYNEYDVFCTRRGYKALGYKKFKNAVESGYGISSKKYNDGLHLEGISKIAA